MTSGYSRPQKFVREVTGVSSLEEAERLRQQPFWLVVHESAAIRAPSLVRALIAIAVRAHSGEIHIRVCGDSEFLNNVESVMLHEARNYDCISRTSIAGYSHSETLGRGITIGVQLPEMIAVDASGMYAAVNQVLGPNAPAPHSAAACFAAATGFAKHFAGSVLRNSVSASESWGFSLDSMAIAKPATTTAEYQIRRETPLGKIHLLGAGAIGSSFCFSVNLSDDKAEIYILDRETYDVPNHETTFFLSESEAARCPEKAEHLARKSSREGVSVTNLPRRELCLGDEFLQRPCDTFVCAVDNPGTRRILDSAQCGVLLNAGLGGTKYDAGHVLVTWHNAGVNRLAELYPDSNSSSSGNFTSLPKEITDECSTLEYESVPLAAPFVALSSGALLHGLCCLAAEGRLPDANYLKFDLLGLQSQILRHLCY